jgi:uncharacterized protein (DUF2147 family)
MNVRNIARGIAIALLVSCAGAQAADGMSPEGRWLTADGTASVVIAHCGDTLCGRIVALLDKRPNVPSTDINNGDSHLRPRPLVGLSVLSGFRATGGNWTGGRAYDPKSGRTYRASFTLTSPRTLELTGCILFICHSQDWRRLP